MPEGLSGTDWQLVVADNASTDDTVAITRELVPAARLVEMGHNTGWSAALNAGISAADEFDAVMVLNPDIRLVPGSGLAMYDVFGREGDIERVGIVAPRMYDGGGNLSPSLRREPTVTRALGEAVFGTCAGQYHRVLGETVYDETAYAQNTTADWATGACLLISAECLAATGPWDESFFLYSEETEYALRARDRGFRTMLAPDAQVIHLGGGSCGDIGNSETSPRLWSILTLSKVRMYRKRHSLLAYAVYWSVVFLGQSVAAAIGRPWGRRAVAVLLRPSKVELG
ncbi:glycosyl transferase family 2 [Rhizocola hellebori]|uniref:Glycosyl transferase family 2 n=1 Tax=Rhizocola hellebori TaxID=1392758 RepID=A0A8J3Q4S9_9ACTN|nr:glycosyl transferase family 2 [Rhizocola hellebori]